MITETCNLSDKVIKVISANKIKSCYYVAVKMICLMQVQIMLSVLLTCCSFLKWLQKFGIQVLKLMNTYIFLIFAKYMPHRFTSSHREDNKYIGGYYK